MNIKWDIRKEILEGIRNYRFLILFVGFLFFAILDPILNKFVLPGVLKSQMNGITDDAIKQMLVSSQIGVIRGYLGDVFEVITIIIVFTLSGVTAREISEKTLILPLCTGKRYGSLIISKLIVYGTALILAATLSALVCYGYSGAMFGFDRTSITAVIFAGLLQGLFMVFILGMLIVIGAFVRKPIIAGLLTLIPAYGSGLIGNLFRIDRYLPSGLLTEGNLLAVMPSPAVIETILCTAAIIVLAVGFTLIRLSKMELSRG